MIPRCPHLPGGQGRSWPAGYMIARGIGVADLGSPPIRCAQCRLSLTPTHKHVCQRSPRCPYDASCLSIRVFLSPVGEGQRAAKPFVATPPCSRAPVQSAAWDPPSMPHHRRLPDVVTESVGNRRLADTEASREGIRGQERGRPSALRGPLTLPYESVVRATPTQSALDVSRADLPISLRRLHYALDGPTWRSATSA